MYYLHSANLFTEFGGINLPAKVYLDDLAIINQLKICTI